jgi:stress-induced-phosphoprotein 1
LCATTSDPSISLSIPNTSFHSTLQDDAEQAFSTGLEKDPENAQLQRGLQDVRSTKDQSTDAGSAGGAGGLASMLNSSDLWAKLATNPQTAQLLQDQSFVNMMRDIQSNPNSINQYAQDPRLMQVLQLMLSSNAGGAADGAGASGGSGVYASNGPSTSQQSSASKQQQKPKQEEKSKQQKEEEKPESQKEKDKGTAAYKRKAFDEAIEHYTKAIELDPDDISFRTNRAAVYLEKGEYDNCLKECDDAIEHGRSVRADYKVIAKAIMRKGNVYFKRDNLDEAISLYQSALTEHRNAETLNKLREAEKLQRQRKEEEYKDPELGQQARDRGNERFKNGSYPDAIKEYEEAIKRNPNDFKAYSNRAACYTKLASWYEAYKDAEKCIEIDPTFPKGYSRKAHVHYFMKEYHKALDTYSAGLEHDPNNEELQQGLRRTREQIARANRGELSEEEDKERHERAMQDPEIQQILNDASMQQVLQDIQSNPQSAQSWLQNAAVAQKLKRLSDAGVVKMQ